LALPGLGFFFALGVNGSGFIFRSARRTSSSLGGFGMAENSNYLNVLAQILMEKPLEKEHFEEFGRFIAAFAQTEAQVHTLARWPSKMDDERARIVFHGLRITDSIDRLLALARIATRPKHLLGGEELRPDHAKIVTEAISQFQIVGTTRHKLVHRTVRMTLAGLHVTNAFTAKNILSVEGDLVITLQDLKNMKQDCAVIYLQLAAIMHPERGDGLDGPSDYGPWRYTPPPQAPQKPKHGKGQKSPKPRPRS
jgi:hypothetical protein